MRPFDGQLYKVGSTEDDDAFENWKTLPAPLDYMQSLYKSLSSRCALPTKFINPKMTIFNLRIIQAAWPTKKHMML